MKKAWAGWKWVLRRVGNFQASILLTLTYVVIIPLIAIPFRLLADPLRIKKSREAFMNDPGVDRVSLEAARKQ
jgi:hypothetical protein